MRNQLYRFMPIVFGLFLGWLLLHPPQWFQALGPLGWVLNGALCALLLLSSVPLVVLAALPEELRTRPLAPNEIPRELAPVRQQLANLGFREIQPALLVEVAPNAKVLGFMHASEPVYATAFRTTTVPAKSGSDFVSILDGDRGGLTTSANPAGAVLPASAGEFRQVLPEQGPASLFRAHIEGIAYLRQQGVGVRPVSAEEFPRDLALAIRHQRRTFLSAPLRSSLLTFWRAATKKVPFVGRLSDQVIASRQLQCLLTGRSGGAF